jgi:hypothetical protein
MAANKVVHAYFPRDLVLKMDQYRLELQGRFPGMKASRSQILRILVEKGLEREEGGYA